MSALVQEGEDDLTRAISGEHECGDSVGAAASDDRALVREAGQGQAGATDGAEVVHLLRASKAEDVLYEAESMRQN
jgi:hypothetical protein